MSAVFIGVDLEQFIADPHATGIQRVLQFLAQEWPADIDAAFVLPQGGQLVMVDPRTASQLVATAFEERSNEDDLAVRIQGAVASIDSTPVTEPIEKTFTHWLLPEVSYVPSVLMRARTMQAKGTLTMIGYDALPMTEPANYRFIPGHAAEVSEYFRLLAQAQHVVAISDYSRSSIDTALRRHFRTDVAHPGGDHMPVAPGWIPDEPTFLRVGTLESRKQPVEILQAFERAVDEGVRATLRFIGRPSASDEAINDRLRASINEGYPVEWVEGAPDSQVREALHAASYFLSIGVEGYGIPVLESIRVGTPVLYGGIQPAAEIMEGRGAKCIESDSIESMTEAFAAAAGSPPPSTDPDAVPTWRDFATHVAHAAIRPPLAS